MQYQRNTKPADETADPGTTPTRPLRALRRMGWQVLKPVSVTDDTSSIYPERGSIASALTRGGAEEDLQPLSRTDQGGTTSDPALALSGSPQRLSRGLQMRRTGHPLRLAGNGTLRSPKLEGSDGHRPPPPEGSNRSACSDTSRSRYPSLTGTQRKRYSLFAQGPRRRYQCSPQGRSRRKRYPSSATRRGKQTTSSTGARDNRFKEGAFP